MTIGDKDARFWKYDEKIELITLVLRWIVNDIIKIINEIENTPVRIINM